MKSSGITECLEILKWWLILTGVSSRDQDDAFGLLECLGLQEDTIGARLVLAMVNHIAVQDLHSDQLRVGVLPRQINQRLDTPSSFFIFKQRAIKSSN